MRIVIAEQLTRADAKRIRRQFLLDNMDHNRKLAYFAKVDFGNPGDNSRQTWIVFADA